MHFKEENNYLAIANKIITEGYKDKSRTSIDIRKIHCAHMGFDLLNMRIPVLSSRKIPVKAPIIELLWFLSGSTDIKFLKDNNVGIWDSWVKPETAVYDNSLMLGIEQLKSKGLIKTGPDFNEDFFIKYGPGFVNQFLSELTGEKLPDRKLIGGSIGEGAYGAQWRKWEDIRVVDKSIAEDLVRTKGYEFIGDTDNGMKTIVRKEYDQIQEAIDQIKNNEQSRRIVVSAWNPGKLDLAVLPPCFTEDALVASPIGYKPIKDIEIGDIVYSGSGKKRNVIQKWVTPYKGEMFSFRVDYVSQPIKCTPNHPFLVKGKGYIEAKDIKEDDVLAIPRTKNIKNHTHKYKVKQLVGGFNSGVEEVDLEHELTLEDYFTLGYYLGNGWCSEKKHRICFAIPHKKRDWILDCIRKTIKVSIKPGPNKSCATYETKSKKFFELFKSFGQGAFNKQIPDFIMQSSVKFKYEFIRGYLEADGCTDDKGNKNFTTVSPSLAYGLQRLLIETGRMASVQYQKRPPKTIIEGRIVNQKDTYTITLTAHGGWHSQMKSTSFDMDYAWIGIKKIEKFDFDGNVYNFGLDEEHTYLVNNIANHNCHSFFQFLPFEKDGVKYLDIALTCRSQDFLVGTVFNVFQYGVLCQMVAHLTGRKANRLYWTGNNTHIYENQVELFIDQHSERSPLLNANLALEITDKDNIKTIDDFNLKNIKVVGYNEFQEKIDYPIAV